MRIETTPRFRHLFRKLTSREQARAQAVLDSILAGFGDPHAHAGLGIRKLRRHWFECRAGLDLRLVFLAAPGLLTFDLAGNHEDVARFLKGL